MKKAAVIEEDDGVRDVASRFLERLGYDSVKRYPGAKEFLSEQGYNPQLDLILTDLRMHRENNAGLEMIAQLPKYKGRIVVMSGDPGSYREQLERYPGIGSRVRFLPKPLRMRQLRSAISD